MDTWKAVDEEGNLAFMRGSRLLYEQTGKAEFLQYMKDSAGYEFLWRYGYKTYPEHTPLKTRGGPAWRRRRYLGFQPAYPPHGGYY